MKRTCGECQLCCQLLPMQGDGNTLIEETKQLMVTHGMAKPADFDGMSDDFNKPADEVCKHQCAGGCAIYPKRPFGCRLWECAWLQGVDVHKPSECHYVVDTVPDVIRINGQECSALQVWIDPAHKDAHRDPRLRVAIDTAGLPAIIRYSSRDGFVLFPPSFAGTWIEQRSENDDTLGIHGNIERLIHETTTKQNP